MKYPPASPSVSKKIIPVPWLYELTEIGARVHGKVNLLNVIIGVGGRLGAAQGALDIRVANIELIEVLCEWLKLLGLDLYHT